MFLCLFKSPELCNKNFTPVLSHKKTCLSFYLLFSGIWDNRCSHWWGDPSVHNLQCVLCDKPFCIIIYHNHRPSCSPDVWTKIYKPWFCCYLWFAPIWFSEFTFIRASMRVKQLNLIYSSFCPKAKERQAILYFIQKHCPMVFMSVVIPCPPQHPLSSLHTAAQPTSLVVFT